MTSSQFLTPAELSQRWGGRIHVRTLANWRTTGDGPPFFKIGGAVLYRIDVVEQWELERMATSTSNYRDD